MKLFTKSASATIRPAVMKSALAALLFSATTPVAADWSHRFSGIAGAQSTDNQDANVEKASTQGFLELSSRGKYEVNRTDHFFYNARGFYASETINLDSEDGGRLASDFIELREFYYRAALTETANLTAKVGRIRLREDTGIWWDRNLSALEFSLIRSLVTLRGGLGQQLNSFRTDNSDYRGRDENKLRLFSSLSIQWLSGQYVTFNYSFLDDSSGSQNTLNSDPEVGDDRLDVTASWLGIRSSGSLKLSSMGKFGYDIGHIVQIGDLVEYDSANVETKKDVDGWLFYTDLNLSFNRPNSPIFGMHFFSTSDNSDVSTEGRFFQTGLQSNRAKFTNNSQYMYRFSEAFRPELSNLRVFGSYAGFKPSPRVELSVVLNQYERVNSSLDIGSSILRSSFILIDGEDELGSSFDLVVSYEFDGNLKVIDKSILRLRASTFTLGKAYEETNDQNVTRLVVDVQVKF